jgi:thiosulfate/3-mercaptopyruvate sulfurtransferase
VVVLDTRADHEVAAGTIPGAIHLEWIRTLTPLGSLRPPEELRRLFAGAGVAAAPAERVVTFCASGYRSAHTYVVLRALGYPAVANYAPSWNEWGQRPELPVARREVRG